MITIETFLGTGLFILVGLIVFWMIAAWINNNPASTGGGYIEPAKPSQPQTYTNEEILLPGVDIRRKDARKQIEVSRKAVAARRTPAWAGYYLEKQMQANRRVLPERTDDVIEGEVRDVPQIDAPKRNRLRG